MCSAREASVLPADEKRAKQTEMARLAAERLGDTRLAIEIYNPILAEAGAGSTPRDARGARRRSTSARSAGSRSPRSCIARSPALLAEPTRPKEAIALLEKLGQVYADRLAAPQAAAAAWQEVLDLEPNHAQGAAHAARAVRDGRRLRRPRAAVRAARPGGGARRRAARDRRSPRRARRSGCRSSSAPRSSRSSAPSARRSPKRRAAQRDPRTPRATLERARQVWERVLAVEPQHIGAAAALAPIYAKQEKWARLITVLEIELAAAPDVGARLAKIAADPPALRAEARVAHARVHVDAARVRSRSGERGAVRRRAAARERARAVARGRGGVRAQRSRGRAARPSDRGSSCSASSRRSRAAGSPIPSARAAITARSSRSRPRTARPSSTSRSSRSSSPTGPSCSRRIAGAPRARRTPTRARVAADRDRVAAGGEARRSRRRRRDVSRGARSALPGQLRALRALARIEEARGDWESLVDVLAEELAADAGRPGAVRSADAARQPRGAAASSGRRTALGYYREALGDPGARRRRAPAGGRARSRASCPPTARAARIDPTERVAAARLVLPHLEAAKNVADAGARARGDPRRRVDRAPPRRLELDRQLMRLYHIDLGDPAAAWQRGSARARGRAGGRRGPRRARRARGPARPRRRVGAPARRRARDAAGPKRRPRRPRSAPSRPSSRGSRASGSATAPTAERAWLTVLEVEPDAADAFDALDRGVPRRAALDRSARAARAARRGHARRPDAAARRCSSSRSSRRTCSAEPARAIAAHRRVLELDPALPRRRTRRSIGCTPPPGSGRSSRSCSRARPITSAAPREQVELAYRRAELFAHRLGEPDARRRSARGRDRAPARPRRRARAARGAAAARRRSRCASRACSSRSTSRTSCGATSSACSARSARSPPAPRPSSCCRGSRRSRRPSSAARATRSTRWLEVLGARPDARACARRAVAARAGSSAAGPRRPPRSRPPRAPRRRATSRRARALLGELATYYDVAARRCAARDHRVPPAARGRSVEPDHDPPRGAALARLYEEARTGPSCAPSCASRPSGPRIRRRAARAARPRRAARGGAARRPRRRDRDLARRARRSADRRRRAQRARAALPGRGAAGAS